MLLLISQHKLSRKDVAQTILCTVSDNLAEHVRDAESNYFTLCGDYSETLSSC